MIEPTVTTLIQTPQTAMKGSRIEDYLNDRFTQCRICQDISALPQPKERPLIVFLKRIFNRSYETPKINYAARVLIDMKMICAEVRVHASLNGLKLVDCISHMNKDRVAVRMDYDNGEGGIERVTIALQ